MAKEVINKMKLVMPAGRASMAPPYGPALSPTGLANEIITKFNEVTAEIENGMPIPAVITIFDDRSFDIVLKTPPTSELIKRALGLKAASGVPNLKKVGTLKKEQVLEIIEKKQPDLNTINEESAYRMIEGTAMQMGIEVEPYNN